MFYYAKLNENQVCTEIITRTKELPEGLSGYVKLPEYNQTYFWRKWLGDQWSQETFEPTIQVETLLQNIEDLQTSNAQLNQKITEQEQAIMELTIALALMQGGSE